MIFPQTGLYAITQTDNKNADQIIKGVSAALKGGARVIQYRDKNPDDQVYLAKQLLKICRQYQAPLIINDNAELAGQIGADGVHIGKNDGDIVAARKILGSDAIIGQSCYNDINLALQAEKNGANYVAFGRFFPSNSKPLALPADIDTLQLASVQIKIPIVAIGGILPENGRSLLEAGADLLAVIGGVFDFDAESAARRYTELFNNPVD